MLLMHERELMHVCLQSSGFFHLVSAQLGARIANNRTVKPTLRLWHFLGIVLPTVFMQMHLPKDKLTELCTRIQEMIFNLLSKRLL